MAAMEAEFRHAPSFAVARCRIGGGDRLKVEAGAAIATPMAIPNLPVFLSVPMLSEPRRRTPPLPRSGFSSMLLQTGFVPGIFAVALLVTSPPARAQEEAMATTDGELRRLMLEQLHNREYHLPLLGDQDTPIRFHRGRGSIKHGAGATEQVQAGLVADLVALLATSTVTRPPMRLSSSSSTQAAAARSSTCWRCRTAKSRRFRRHASSWATQRVAGTVCEHRHEDMTAPDGEAFHACPITHRSRCAARSRCTAPSGWCLPIQSPLAGETLATGVEVQRRTSTHPSADGLAYLAFERSRRSDRHAEDPRCGGLG